MSYLNPLASTTQYGVVEVGANINVTQGIISLTQDLSPSGSPAFAALAVTGNVTAHGNEVVESVTPIARSGIAITNVVTVGPATTFTVSNTGVLSNIAGPGINVSGPDGNVTISNSGVTSIVAGAGVSVSNATGTVTISATGSNTVSTRLVTTATYTATASDEYIGVDSTVPVVITLPTGVTGATYIVKEEHGSGFGLITVQGTGGQLIDGAPTTLLNVPFSSITVIFRGTKWHTV